MTTATPVVVGVVHQNSGPGFVVYACQVCAPHCAPQPEVLTDPEDSTIAVQRAGHRDLDLST